MKNMSQQTVRVVASACMLAIIVLLMMYLTFIEVPDGNKDIIITILGVLLGAGAAAIPNLFGDNDKEKEHLKERVRQLETRVVEITAINETLSKELTEIRTMLINRHIVDATGIKTKDF